MLSQEYRGASSYYERTAMKVDGGCPCESIRYTAEIEEDRVIICHCTDCRTLSGSAFRVVVQTVPVSFELLSGEPRIYTKVAESGVARKKGVCPECGTPVFSRPSGGHTSALGLRVGTITQRDELLSERPVLVPIIARLAGRTGRHPFTGNSADLPCWRDYR